jgi:hypothetical protein
MKKIIIALLLFTNIILSTTLFYVLNLEYYDSYCNCNGCYNYEEKIIDLVKRVIAEQGGIFYE